MLTLLDKVTEYKKVVNRFHTPGQSFSINDELYASSKYDITELSFSDNLLYPNGVIRQLESELEKIYHTKRSKVITTGATCGNFIGLNILKKFGKVLITPGCHKSIYSAVRLFDIDAIFMDNKDSDLPVNVTFEDIKPYLDSTIKSVVITSPNYFGKVVNTALITKLQSMGLLVMVDEAHGGHFVFSKLLPDSLASIADITIDSVHKTLPVFTGGAIIHTSNDALLTELELYHSLLHSSSPNYVTMCSIDYMQDLFSREGERLYDELFEVVKNISLDRFKVVKTDDFSRLVIDVFPFDGLFVQQQLEQNKVFIEMSYKHYLVLILSPLNINSLVNSVDIINKVSKNIKLNEDNKYKGNVSQIIASEKIDKVSKSKAVELVDIVKSVGRVSSVEVGIYPPGVPLIRSGEEITRDKAKYLLENEEKLFGVVKGKIFVYKKE